MFCTDIPDPKYLIFSDSVPSLLYYSHIPTAAIALALAFFIFLKNKKEIASILLFIIASLFSVWSFLDLILWTNNNSTLIIFSWLLIRIVEVLIPIFVLYFSYWLIKKKDPPFFIKSFFLVLVIPVLIFIPTTFHFQTFDLSLCEPIEGSTLNYLHFFEPFVFISLVFFLIKEIFKEKNQSRKKIVLISLGSSFFLLSFLGTNLLGSFTLDWKTLQYGLFGMPIFMGFLSYLILKYQAFDIKVIAGQFLVISVWMGVFSQLFISNQNQENLMLAITTLTLTTVLGYIIFRSVKQEVVLAEGVRESSEKLLKINKKLEELDRAKSEFISIASHQLRTPLTSIKGFSSLLLENTFGKVPEKQKEAINKIFVNNEKLVLLVEDMLNVSRLESGRLQYDFEETEIVPLVGDVIKNLKLYAKNKKLYLKFLKPKEALPLILADQRKLSEIVANLIDNAIKYTPKGGVTVTIESFERSQKVGKFEGTGTFDQTWVRVRVKDTGIGMSEEETVSIFEKFKKGNYTEEENGVLVSGTGLGVYISRQMTHASSGKLFAKSPGKNKGSEFILELPGIKENGK